MGMWGSSIKSSSGRTTYVPPDPNPHRFKIAHIYENGGLCAVFAKYDGCTTYNGNKVMVLEISPEELKRLTRLDPHFLTSEEVSPIARFPGDPAGFAQAVAYCKFHVENNLQWYVVCPVNGENGPFKTRRDAQVFLTKNDDIEAAHLALKPSGDR